MTTNLSLVLIYMMFMIMRCMMSKTKLLPWRWTVRRISWSSLIFQGQERFHSQEAAWAEIKYPQCYIQIEGRENYLKNIYIAIRLRWKIDDKLVFGWWCFCHVQPWRFASFQILHLFWITTEDSSLLLAPIMRNFHEIFHSFECS